MQITANMESIISSSTAVSELITGRCGENLKFSINLESGVCTISGTGEMCNSKEFSSPYRHWKQYFLLITEVVINEGVTNIGDHAFDGCFGLTSIKIPNGVTRIGKCAFYGCIGLTSIVIPNSVISIGALAFGGNCFLSNHCFNLTSITIPESVVSIGTHAFSCCYFKWKNFINKSHCKSDENWGATLCDIETEDGLLISDDVVVKCRPKATSIIIPDNVTTIRDYAFSDCRKLVSVCIPESVTTIGHFAFANCFSLVSITLHEKIFNVSDHAFCGCFFKWNKFLNNSSCRSTENWGATICDTESNDGLLIRDNEVVKCRPWAISVTIPKSVTRISISAFSGCFDLKKLSYNALNCTSCGDSLYGSPFPYSLEEVVIGNEVETIPDYAFMACSKLTSMTIPESVTCIGNYAFMDCM